MTNPPHGDAEPDEPPAPGPDGHPPAEPPRYGASAWGPHPWSPPGAAADGQPFGATQPYGQLPATFGLPGQGPRPPWGQQHGPSPVGFGSPPGAGPYGAPGQPAGRRRSRAGGYAALAVAVAVLIGLGVLALSTGPTVLSRTAVERDVAAQFELREGVAVDLQCAQEMTVEEGATYECTGVTADDEHVTLKIEITDEDGARYTWTEP